MQFDELLATRSSHHTVVFHQSVFSVATGRVAAEIETRIVSINYKTNKRTPIPAAYRKEVWYGMVEYGIIKHTYLID